MGDKGVVAAHHRSDRDLGAIRGYGTCGEGAGIHTLAYAVYSRRRENVIAKDKKFRKK